MIFQKKDHMSVGQNSPVIKPKKHDANLQKNTTLYFQAGLILALFAVYGLFEMQFQYIIPDPPEIALLDNVDVIVDIDNVKIYEEQAPKEELQSQKKTMQLIDDPVIVSNDQPNQSLSRIITSEGNASNEPNLDPGEVDVIDIEEEFPLITVHNVPIYPGCEKFKTNADRRKCFSDKVVKLVQRKFNTSIAENVGLSGRQRFQILFKIDKLGNVVDIKTNAKHSLLDSEAQRVMNKIPKMIPGKHNQKPVTVLYSLPIIFQIH